MRPRFSLTVGALRASTEDPIGLPERIVVERDMDVPVDALRLRLGQAIDIAPGEPVAVSLGYDELRSVFTGSVAVARRTLTGAEVWALGSALALVRARVSAGYERRDAGSIVRDLAGRAGVGTGIVEPGAILPWYAVDAAQPAYEHARALADRFGFELYTDRLGRLMFHTPGTAGPRVGYAYSRDLLAADGLARAAVPDPVVGGESPSSEGGEDTAHWLTTANLTGGAAGGTLVLDPVARTQDLADRFAAGYAAVRRRSRRRIRIRVLGNAAAELGERTGVTGPLAGDGYVRALRHEFGASSGWVTELWVGGELS